MTLERAFQNSDSNGLIDSVNAQLRDLKDASWAVGTPEGLAMLQDQRNALFDSSLWIEELPGVEAEIRKHIEAGGQPTSRGACTESKILIGTTAKPQSMRKAIGRKARNVV